MLGRILNNHKKIHTLNELHFFEWLASTNSLNEQITKEEAIQLLSKLFCIEAYGLFSRKKHNEFFHKSNNTLLNKKEITPIEVYKIFLSEIMKEQKSAIICEQTPKNAFYIYEILDAFPDALFVNMIRDGRDVLLSQKNKWKRKFLGAKAIPLTESIRAFVNYNPLINGKLWNSAVSKVYTHKEKPYLINIRFEDLLSNPEKEIKKICLFLGVTFDDKMIKIPNIGSSTNSDNLEELKIDSSKMGKWTKGGLNASEIYLFQMITKDNLKKYNYKIKDFHLPPFFSIFYILILPFKVSLSLFFNLHRIKSIKHTLYNRFFSK